MHDKDIKNAQFYIIGFCFNVQYIIIHVFALSLLSVTALRGQKIMNFTLKLHDEIHI